MLFLCFDDNPLTLGYLTALLRPLSDDFPVYKIEPCAEKTRLSFPIVTESCTSFRPRIHILMRGKSLRLRSKLSYCSLSMSLSTSSSAASPSVFSSDIIVNIVFGITATLISAITIYQGNKMWKL